MAKKEFGRNVRSFMKIMVIVVVPLLLLGIMPLGICVFMAVQDLCGKECKDAKGCVAKVICVSSLFFRSLPTDEAMIEHFRRHRKDFERLVEFYQHDEGPLHSAYLERVPTEIRAIMVRINICEMSSDNRFWTSPDPNAKGVGKRIKYYSLPEKLLQDPAGTRKHTGIHLWYSHESVYRGPWIQLDKIEPTKVWKRYYFIPVGPDVLPGCRAALEKCAIPLFVTLNQ